MEASRRKVFFLASDARSTGVEVSAVWEVLRVGTLSLCLFPQPWFSNGCMRASFSSSYPPFLHHSCSVCSLPFRCVCLLAHRFRARYFAGLSLKHSFEF